MSAPRWEDALGALAEGLALLDDAGRVVSCNAAFCAITGLDASEVARQPVLGDRVRWLSADFLGEPPQRRETRRGDRWFEVRTDAIAGGTVVALVETTGRRTTADALRATGEMLAAIVEAAPVAIVATDPSQRVTLWNPAATRMFGWTKEEMIGAPYTRVIPAEELEGFAGLFARVIGGEGFAGAHAERMRRDGSRFPVRISTAPLRDASGTVVGVTALLDDLSDRRRLEAQIQQAERLEAIGRLAGGIAHDFNNLLTVILSACDVLADPDPNEPVSEVVDDIRRGAERAAELTRQLLAFSRRQVLQPERIAVAGVIRETAAMVERLLGPGITVHVAVQEPLHVQVDPTELHRALLNLGVNARDAMPRGGALTFSAGYGEGDQVEIAVRDTGVGIAPEDLEHIYEPFFTTKHTTGGTGLGLAMVYGFVQQSGGEIRVSSELDQGTTFTITLPVSRPATPTQASRGATPAGATVLLAEDEEDVRSTLRQLLASRGYHVIAAESGAAAIAASEAHEGPIDVLLTDVMMPGMSGRELADALALRRPELRVIFMSGYTDDAVLRDGIARAAAAFLQKPFSARALDARIRQVLGR